MCGSPETGCLFLWLYDCVIITTIGICFLSIIVV